MQLTKRRVVLMVFVLMGFGSLLKWRFADPEALVRSPAPAPSTTLPPVGLGAAVVPEARSSSDSKASSAPVAPAALDSASQAAPAAVPAWTRNTPDLGLTHVLSGDQSVSLAGKRYKVLGTKPSMSEATLGQPVLLLRDEKSGQIEYFQSGLQFRLAAGVSYASFLREHPQMQVVFYNDDFARVKLDAALIAESFKKLTADPRVTFVGFLLPQAVVKPK